MSYSISTLLTAIFATSSVRTTRPVGAQRLTRSSPRIAGSTIQWAFTEAATRSISRGHGQGYSP